jgi:hypothetical protein
MGDFSNVIQRLENWNMNTSMRFMGDIHLKSEWIIEKQNAEFLISKSRPIDGYSEKSLSNFIAITKFKDKAVIEIQIKAFSSLGINSYYCRHVISNHILNIS